MVGLPCPPGCDDTCPVPLHVPLHGCARELHEAGEVARVSGPDAAVKVLSVVGAGRSGTTILASILQEVDGLTSAGETRWLWERGVREGRPCGCGDAPSDCPVWSRVIEGTLASLGQEITGDVDSIVAAQREVARRANYPRILRSIGAPHTDWTALRVVRDATRSVYSELARATGSHLVVDISKRPLDAAVVAGLDGIEHYVLHMVRDPRAVVHSWRRAKTFMAGGRSRTMGTRSMLSTVRRWTGNSLAAEALRRRTPRTRWCRIRYEEFAADPRGAVTGILAFLDEHGEAPFVDASTVLLAPNHIVAGNPSRFTTGRVGIRVDEGWRHAMPRRDQWLTALLTLPLMLRYGYLPPRHRPGAG